MVDIISVEKKYADETEELFSSSADDGRDCESKANSHGQPMSKPVHRRTWSNIRHAQKANYRKVGLRRRAVSDNHFRNHPLQRSQTLTATNRSHYVPSTPTVDEGIIKDADAAAVVNEFRPILDDLGEQINKIEQRFDKQLGAFHKRFEKMEKMQLTILAYIQKLSQSKTFPVQQHTPGTKIPQGMISHGI